MKSRKVFVVVPVCMAAALVAHACWAEDAYFGRMKANNVLFLGNSMCLIPSKTSGVTGRGLQASSLDKDYVHLTASSITAVTGTALRLHPQMAEDWNADGTYLNTGNANVVNVADIFERGYATYPGSGRLQWQLDWKPDIAVIQIGENVSSNGFNAAKFKDGLKTLLADLKQSNNPNIFVTSCIMGAKSYVDNIKREVINEDTSGRVYYVDMSYVYGHPDIYLTGRGHHPNDVGMAKISEILFDSIKAHSRSEPNSLSLILMSGLAATGFAWRRHRRLRDGAALCVTGESALAKENI